MAEASPFRYARADDSAGFLLWKITVLWQRKLKAVLGEFGISQTQYAILASLRWFEEKQTPPTQSHIVDHAKIDKMTLSKAIRKLESAGFVLRRRLPSDNRATTVLFTVEGRRVIKNAIKAVENADEDFFSCLSEPQMDTYKSLTVAVIKDNHSPILEREA
jgi:MarR family transcriptional regulator for hemolysin